MPYSLKIRHQKLRWKSGYRRKKQHRKFCCSTRAPSSLIPVGIVYSQNDSMEAREPEMHRLPPLALDEGKSPPCYSCITLLEKVDGKTSSQCCNGCSHSLFLQSPNSFFHSMPEASSR